MWSTLSHASLLRNRLLLMVKFFVSSIYPFLFQAKNFPTIFPFLHLHPFLSIRPAFSNRFENFCLKWVFDYSWAIFAIEGLMDAWKLKWIKVGLWICVTSSMRVLVIEKKVKAKFENFNVCLSWQDWSNVGVEFTLTKGECKLDVEVLNLFS